MPTIKLGRKILKTLPTTYNRAVTFYDSALKGFGLKMLPSGARSWIVEFRPGYGGRSVAKRRMVIGSASTLTPEQARKLATHTLARVRLGEDPASKRAQARKSENVADLLSRYMNEKILPKRKPGTARLFDGYIRNHINPTFGTRKATSVTHSDVAKLHASVGKEHPVTANHLLMLLNAAYNYGVKTGTFPKELASPAQGIDKYPEQSRERYLTGIELARLGKAIREGETIGIPWTLSETSKPASKHVRKRPENRRTIIGPHVAAALRLLLFTGARLREVLDLQWEHVDLQRGLLNLPDSKSGKKTIVLGAPAVAILQTVPKLGRFVIAGNEFHKARADLKRPWALGS